MIYLNWPIDISLDTLKVLEEAFARTASQMEDDNARNRMQRERNAKWPNPRYSQHMITELRNLANEARAMVQKASIGAIKVQRRQPSIEEDDILA